MAKKSKQLDPSVLEGLSYEETIILLSSKGNYIQFIEDPTEEQCIAAVKQNGYALRHIKNQSKELIDIAIAKQPTAIQFANDPTTEQINRCFLREPTVIAYIDSPTYEQKVSAVSRKGGTIQYIKNPDEHLIDIALKNQPMALAYIIDLVPIDKIREVIKKQPKAVKNIIDKLPIEDKRNILANYGSALRYVHHQTEELCLLAVNNNPEAIRFVKEQTEDIQKAVINSNNRKAIEYLDLSNKVIQKELVIQKPKAINLIDKPDDDIVDIYNKTLLKEDKKAKKERYEYKITPKDKLKFNEHLKDMVENLTSSNDIKVEVLDNKMPIGFIINMLSTIIQPQEVDIAVGYLVESGLGLLKDTFKMLYDNGVIANVIIGSLQDYRECTKTEDYLKDMDYETAELINKFVKSDLISLYTYENVFYHGKFFYFKGEKYSFIIQGSSNLSYSGLFKNKELNTLYIFGNDNKFCKPLIQWYDEFLQECTFLEKLDLRVFLKQKRNPHSLRTLSRNDFERKIKALSDSDKQKRLNLWLANNPDKIFRIEEEYSQSFTGYVVLEFYTKQLCVLESFESGNAYYCFNTGSFKDIEADIQNKNKIQMHSHPLLIKRGYHNKDMFNLMLNINNLF